MEVAEGCILYGVSQSKADALVRSQGHTVLFLRPDAHPSAESDAALAWLRGLPDVEAHEVGVADLLGSLPDHRSTLWFHWTEPPEIGDAERRAIDAHVRGGAGLLATLAAVMLPAQLGWERVPPDEITVSSWEESEDDLSSDFSQQRPMRGLQSFRGHPLFNGLGSGAYTWTPSEGERFVRYAYAGDRWPEGGRAVAVEKSFIAMNADRRLAWEYTVGDGWVVCIGGYIYFASPDLTYRPHLESVVRNAIRRAAPNGHGVRDLGGAWTPPKLGLAHDESIPLPPQIGDAQLPTAGPTLERAATDNEYTLAGSRTLLVGRERTGHEEIWFHPNRAVSRWTLTAGDTVGKDCLTVTAKHISVRHGAVERTLDLCGHTVHESSVVARHEPAVLVELSTEDTPIQAVWTLESDLRLMWPYPVWSVGGLSYVQGAGAVGVSSDTGEWLGVRIEPPPVSLTVLDTSDEDRSRIRVTAELELSGRTRILICGSGAGEQSVDAMSKAHKSLSDMNVTLKPLLSTAGIEDPALGEALSWAAYRLASYRVHVPGLGTCLVAGYGRSRPGHFGDGRPGYAWFFGRDACWTALACLAIGECVMARETLQFLGRHQDISGKILHECTTSGVVHYDAADSTPLYLLLAARYHSVTGDGATLEREWPRIVKAYEFCLSTDSDGDGLIENTGVGHGWIEFGRLGESHVSLYLAGVWVGALSELEVCARTLDKSEFADELAYRAAAARASLELSFYDPLEDRYATGRRADGSKNMAETVMTAVPLFLGAITPERCSGWLDRVAGEDFTADWGVRLVPRSDPNYEPDGYHAGSIWPLYTGWVSLAERLAGRVESADRHWRQVTSLYKACALGAWPEVLHGEEVRSIGVTSDQAWSTAMALLPLLAR